MEEFPCKAPWKIGAIMKIVSTMVRDSTSAKNDRSHSSVSGGANNKAPSADPASQWLRAPDQS